MDANQEEARARTRTQLDDGIARITLDDGKVNALSVPMLAEIDAALDAAESAGAVVVLRGRPGVFSAGFDLATFKKGAAATLEMLSAGCRLYERLLAFPRPVLTVCSGHAYPAGAFLMLAADVRFGSHGPWKIGMNEVAIGLTLPRFAIELARHRLTPPGFARITTGDMFPPEEALRFGYLDRLHDAAALDDAVETEIGRLRALDMTAFAETKRRVNEHAIAAIHAAAVAELRAVVA